jgi:hypothetical protein
LELQRHDARLFLRCELLDDHQQPVSLCLGLRRREHHEHRRRDDPTHVLDAYPHVTLSLWFLDSATVSTGCDIVVWNNVSPVQLTYGRCN